MSDGNNMPAWAAMEMINMLISRVADLEARMPASAEEDENDPYPPVGGQGGITGWPGKVYVLGVTYSGLTNTAMPYVRVKLGAGGTVSVEETDEAFPSEMPPNEEWYIKAEETVPPRITRFG